MPERRRLLVTGASGFIGGAVVRHFVARGWDVSALARRPLPSSPPGVTHVPYALDRAPAVATFTGAQALVHCAFAPGDLALNVAAAEHLLRAGREAGVRHKVFLSSLSARETARSAYGRQKLAIERLFASDGGSMLRAALVLGQGGLFARMRDHLQAGRAVPIIGGGRQPIQIVALADLVRAIDTVIERDLRDLLVVAHPDPVSYRDFYRTLGTRLGRPARLVPIPYHLVAAALFFAESLGLRLPVNRENLLGLRDMTYVDPRESLQRLALTPRSFEQALEDLII